MPVSAEAAIKKGIDRIAFTEHWDEDYPEKYRKATRDFNGPDVMALHPDFDDRPLFTFDIDEYFRALEEVRNFCGDRIQILSGIELGLRPGRPDIVKKYREAVEKYHFDVVLGSVHLVNDEEPFYPELWFKYGADKLIEEYFKHMLACVKEYDFFTSLAHIDYIARYVPKELIDCPPEEYFKGIYKRNEETIDAILNVIIRREQALEVNTKGAYTCIKHVHPSDEIMERYKQLGGTKFTFGSDAHSSDKVGDGIYGI